MPEPILEVLANRELRRAKESAHKDAKTTKKNLVHSSSSCPLCEVFLHIWDLVAQ
jgi:hypothetical protein